MNFPRLPRRSGAVLCLLSLSATAQIAPSEDSLPYFDARLDGDQVRPEVVFDLALARTEAQRNARAEAFDALARRVPDLALSDDEFFGTPHFLRSPHALLTEPAPGLEPLTVVRSFVAQHPALFEVPAEELDLARVRRDFVTQHNGVTHLSLQQQVEGLDLFGAELKANVTADGRLINVSSTLLPRPAGGFALTPVALTPDEALRIAAANVGVELDVLVALGEGRGVDHAQVWEAGDALRSDVAVTSALRTFPLSRTKLTYAWAVVIPVPGIGDTFEMLVDASTGDVLRRWNQLHHVAPAASPLGGNEDATFRVYTEDSPQPGSPGSPTPNGAQFQGVPRAVVTVTGASVAAASPDGWIPDGTNETLGNNVDAHTDLDGDNAPDLPRPQGSPYRVFDFPLDLSQAPSTYAQAAVTNLFYACNNYHDRLYALGFDEAAGNFQEDNFAQGGSGGDRVQADAQDGFGVDNANFGTSGSDGSSARMQMFVWSGPSPDISGDLDSDIVYHEYSHGLSIRLLEGALGGEQSGGMGEGWGDFFGFSLNAKPTDDPHAVYPMGPYATHLLNGLTDNYYFGIRRYPYTTDKSKSPLTYADLDPAQQELPVGIPINPVISQTADTVHNVGETWCNALIACRAELWGSLGFAANELLMQLVVDGLKLTPGTPSMLEARDAILQADLVNNGGANLGDLWAGFAWRGMGGSATSPSGSTTTGIVEAFDIPSLIFYDFPAGRPDELTPNTPTVFTVTLDVLGPDQPLPGTGTLSYSVNGSPFTTVSMLETAPEQYTATLPGFACFDEVEWYVSVDSTAGLVTDPPTAPAGTNAALVFTGETVLFGDDMELDLGWVGGLPGDTATTGIWERVDPVGTAAQPETDATEGAGTQCWVTGQGFPGGGLGDNDVDGGTTSLLSPSFTASADALVSYQRWFSNDTGTAPNADVFVVDISNDGGFNWTNVEVVGPSGPGTAGGWTHFEFRVSDFVTPTGTMRVRFTAEDDPSDGSGSLVEAAIDDFVVRQLLCATCQPDVGFQGPGTTVLSVCGTTLGAGGSADLHLSGSVPNAPLVLILGGQQNPTPLLGGTVVPVPQDATVLLFTDASGEMFLPGLMGGLPVAATVYLQAAVLDFSQPEFFQLSNAVAVQFLP